MIFVIVGYPCVVGVKVLTTHLAGVVHGVMGVYAVFDESMPTGKLPCTLPALADVPLVVT